MANVTVTRSVDARLKLLLDYCGKSCRRRRLGQLEAMDDDAEDVTLFEALQATAQLPARIIGSRTARRTYIRTALLSLAALFLAGLAVFSYTGFYLSYIPQLGFSRPVHLEWEPAFATTHGFPAGDVDVRRGELVAGQAYDVRVRLHMPRAPVNTDAGNFMVDVRLQSVSASSTSRFARAVTPEAASDGWRTVAHARRPAMLRYVSPLMDRAGKFVAFGFYAAGWRDEDEWIEVKLFDRVSFAYGADVPQRVHVELRSEHRLWVYGCTVDVQARFSGLRWLMYNHRIFSFVVFTFVFWVAEMGAALAFWLTSAYMASPPDSADGDDDDGSTDAKNKGKSRAAAATIKSERNEDDDSATEGLSDASRQFPTYSRQPPLRYSPSRGRSDGEDAPVKLESDDGIVSGGGPTAAAAAAEADDEDEDEDADFVLADIADKRGEPGGARSDSGLGTSMESSGAGGSSAGDLRRRRSQRGG